MSANEINAFDVYPVALAEEFDAIGKHMAKLQVELCHQRRSVLCLAQRKQDGILD